MKRYGIWLFIVTILVGTAVACTRPTSQNNQLVVLPPTATFVPLPQDTVESQPSPTSESSASPTATATITPTLAVSEVTTYTVQPGDTLVIISGRFEVPVEEIVEANDLSNPNVIAAGETLLIPQEVTPTNTPTPLPPITPSPEVTEEAEDGGGTPIPPDELAPTGRLELTHPLTMVVEESGVITVELIADPELAQIGEHEPHVTGVVRIDASYDDGERSFYEQTVALFPLMSAELNAPAFEVFPSGGDNVRLPRVISTTLPAVWTWDIIATTAGEAQVITVNLYKEPDSATEVPVLTQSISRNIAVTAKSRWSQFVDGLADNVLLLLGTGGPLGLLLAYLTYRTTRENQQLREKVANTERRETAETNQV
ncbi:LysM peptidoglycan-binding domain-containing protein [Candidatus Leptofilum sp.]|uniref:LysM peptidoglycan-binding domain-containing protein n=1 Tax=Candidatus Leptofilum sp. TaxID=3241576 RepID=UPI003B5D0090